MIRTRPGLLKQGDTVAIVPPAKAIDYSFVEDAIRLFENWQLQTKLSVNIKTREGQYAGCDEERLNALQQLIDDQEIRAIFSARGGYGTTRIIDRLDLKAIRKDPKWIIGYSDITALLHTMYNLGFQSIHGPMPLNFSEKGASESLERLHDLLFHGTFKPINFSPDKMNKTGSAEGEIIGGNLTMITNCLGTASDLPMENRILFLEDVDEYLYRIDRMLVQLKRAGQLSNLAGLIIGQFTRMQDNSIPFGMSVKDMILDLASEYDYPICFGAPVGHEMPNYPIPIGQKMKMEVADDRVILSVSQL